MLVGDLHHELRPLAHGLGRHRARAADLQRHAQRVGRASQAGMRILSLANPEAPVEIGRWPGGSHARTRPPTTCTTACRSATGSTPRRSTPASSACSTSPTRRAPTADRARGPIPAASRTTAWPDATGNVLYVTDEVNGQPLKIFDISTLAAPDAGQRHHARTRRRSSTTRTSRATSSTSSNYTEGIRILDITDPRTRPSSRGPTRGPGCRAASAACGRCVRSSRRAP